MKGISSGLTNYGDVAFSRYLRRSFASSMGYSSELLGRPIVGIAHSASGFNSCHRHFPEMIDAVKRGILSAGGIAIDFPTISLGEAYVSPTSLKYRNLMSMDVEEMIRSQPMDSVVLVGGCDKTVPAQLMGAVSADTPCVQLVAGPMLTGWYKGNRLGACTDCRRYWHQYRAGEIDTTDIAQIERRLVATTGTCAVMGTASTMACLAEALGMMPFGSATVPAVHSGRLRVAEETGRIAFSLVQSSLRPSNIITAESFENALRVLLALGGSTNAVIHLAAIAGRLGLEFGYDQLNRLSETTPVLLDLKPTGKWYMEDFHAAGGMPALLRELRDLLHLDCVTVTGESIGEHMESTDRWVDRAVIRSRKSAMSLHGSIIALRGTLVPRGAILKRSAADPTFFEKEARAVVFTSLADLALRIDDPDLDVTPDDILVLQNAGPASQSAMPEAGCIPIPKKLASLGVGDMVRISDARMSGTAYGTVILHSCPDAASGGPIGLVESGDRIRLSVRSRTLDLLVDERELERRRRRMAQIVRDTERINSRGYSYLYHRHILQADQGCDFDFLTKQPGDAA